MLPSKALDGTQIKNLLVTNADMFNSAIIPDSLDFGSFQLCELSFLEISETDYEAFGYACGEECIDDACRSDLHFTADGMSGEVVVHGVRYFVAANTPVSSSLTKDKMPLEATDLEARRRNLRAQSSRPWHDLCFIFEIGPEIWKQQGMSKEKAMDKVLQYVKTADDIFRPLGWGIKACGFKFAETTRQGKGIFDDLTKTNPLDRSQGNVYYYIGESEEKGDGLLTNGQAALLGIWWGIWPYGFSKFRNAEGTFAHPWRRRCASHHAADVHPNRKLHGRA